MSSIPAVAPLPNDFPAKRERELGPDSDGATLDTDATAARAAGYWPVARDVERKLSLPDEAELIAGRPTTGR
jgi:hypothetical protein